MGNLREKRESWGRAEKVIEKIIFEVRPTNVSEERRKKIIEYVQRLTRNFLGCEVFPYGSVPLKTYLPDGDIDLTAFGGTNSDDVLAEDLVSVLQAEEQNEDAEFIVKDIQFIGAEVKLVKCYVQNIVVDISFNQIGGLCTLCFLEQVDHAIGKDHLFKRSILLVKAWCFYESRVLGAYHGLFSTYALETLVLYIFQIFHSSLNGPLSVLYKFLDYFSKFDWRNYCITLSGPIRLSSLPEFVVDMPDNGGGSLLLSDEFLGECVNMFSVPSREADLNYRAFQPKYLNIVDPLKENNNLGRSVSKGNFHRIQSAFALGALELEQILMKPQEDIEEGLRDFFFSMLDRTGTGQRPDVQGPLDVCRLTGFGPALMVSEAADHDMNASRGESNYGNNNEERDGYAEILPSKMLLPHLFFSEHQDPTARESLVPLRKPFMLPHLVFSRSVSSKNDRYSGVSCRSDRDNGLDVLADLTGDYDIHFDHFLYGREACSQNAFGMAPRPMNAPPPNPYQMRNSQVGAQQPSQFVHNGFSHVDMNVVVPSPGFYTVNPFLVSGMAFGLDEMPKTRGTGTYLPHMLCRPVQGYRPPSARGPNQAPSRSPRNNNRNVMFTETNVADHGIHEFSQSLVSSDQSGSRTGPSDITPSFSPRGKLHPNANTFAYQSHDGFDFSSDGRAAEAAQLERRIPRQPKSPPLKSPPQNSIPVSSPSGMQISQPDPSRDYDRLSMESSYHLKNEDDFPPLSM